MKNKFSDKQISEVMSNPKILAKKLQSGIQAALRKHKQVGNPVCEWRNNKVVWISAENILLKNSNDSNDGAREK